MQLDRVRDSCNYRVPTPDFVGHDPQRETGATGSLAAPAKPTFVAPVELEAPALSSVSMGSGSARGYDPVVPSVGRRVVIDRTDPDESQRTGNSRRSCGDDRLRQSGDRVDAPKAGDQDGNPGGLRLQSGRSPGSETTRSGKQPNGARTKRSGASGRGSHESGTVDGLHRSGGRPEVSTPLLLSEIDGVSPPLDRAGSRPSLDSEYPPARRVWTRRARERSETAVIVIRALVSRGSIPSPADRFID